MHAYSILDVREVKNVSVDFFKEKILSGTLGNVSGFTAFDGTVRLLRIRNPHGKGEWKGEFSDNSAAWEKLLKYRKEGMLSSSQGLDSPGLQRTMKNDGTFWIDYDHFLMGFSNVDVVLAFQDICAMSFTSNFPLKRDNIRCSRAFEVSMIEDQPGVPSRDTVELYIMGIQKTRRGALHGRSDRKKSYKVCDLGVLVGKKSTHANNKIRMEKTGKTADFQFDSIEGRMFGFRRNGHHRLVLNRKKNTSLIVMPISFGHPAATDKEMSFVLRFVSDSSLQIRELPKVPRLDIVMHKFCLEASQEQKSLKDSWQLNREVTPRVLLDNSFDGEPRFKVLQLDFLENGAGTVFIYLSVNDSLVAQKQAIDADTSAVCFRLEAKCRGMVCRTADGLLDYETIKKGKKFEAAWRQYKHEFIGERQSRLLMVLVQSGQDTEMGSIKCERIRFGAAATIASTLEKSNSLPQYFGAEKVLKQPCGPLNDYDDYNKYGIFNGTGLNILNRSRFASHNSNSKKVVNLLGRLDSLDMELEQALALSRGDLELMHALKVSQRNEKCEVVGDQFQGKAFELSRTLNQMSEVDQGTEMAIRESLKVIVGSKPVWESSAAMASESPDSYAFSKDIEKAIKLSLSENHTPLLEPIHFAPTTSKLVAQSKFKTNRRVKTSLAEISQGDADVIEIKDIPPKVLIIDGTGSCDDEEQNIIEKH